MKKFIAKKYWHVFKSMIDRSEIVIGTSVFIITLLVFYIVEKHGAGNYFWGISIKSWSAVFGSLLAASAFLLVQFIIRLAKETKETVHDEQYKHICEKQGVKTIYEQRGSSEIVRLYKSLIEKSTKRVWAIGMTNRHFCNQHFDIILPKLKSKEFDCIISFWDPNIKMVRSGFDENIINLQELIENGVISDSDYVKAIETRIDGLVQKLKKIKSLNGNIKFVYTCSPTNFTCFVIDDDIFFFPFLSGPESTNTPTFHCDATIGIGSQILKHIDLILKNKKITTTQYDNKK